MGGLPGEEATKNLVERRGFTNIASRIEMFAISHYAVSQLA